MQQPMGENRVVLITGASTGIGRAIADHLSRRHFTVFGTCRNPHAYPPPSGWELLPMDVRSDELVNRCVQDVLNRTGHLDVLINNAGYGLDGALEEASLEQIKNQFETNYFGALRTIKAVLPTLRKQSAGYIINISSGSAATRFPYIGHYIATKCALEGYSEVLRKEVAPLGIHVSVIEPAFIKTNISETIQLGEQHIEDYEPMRTEWLEAIRKAVRSGADPKIIADCVASILRNKNPRFMYLSGPGIGLGVWVHRLLPEGLSQWIFNAYYGVKK